MLLFSRQNILLREIHFGYQFSAKKTIVGSRQFPATPTAAFFYFFFLRFPAIPTAAFFYDFPPPRPAAFFNLYFAISRNSNRCIFFFFFTISRHPDCCSFFFERFPATPTVAFYFLFFYVVHFFVGNPFLQRS